MIATTPTTQKHRGAYYTPRALADFLVRWAVRSPTDRVLDPACGEAIFLDSAATRLRELGGEPTDRQLIGYELDGAAAVQARQLVPWAVITESDFFHQEPDGARVEAVVGNPPYIRYHYFSGHVRDRALTRARAEGVLLSSLTSSWAPFVVHATAFLAPNGRLALVLPAELLSTDYAGSVRTFLRRRFAAIDVLTFEERVFPGVLVDAVLVLAEGQGPGEVRVHRLPNAAALARFDPGNKSPTVAMKWTHALVGDDAAEAFAAVTSQMCRLGTIATVDIGVVTGANNFFLLTEPEAKEAGLLRTHLRRLVARGNQLPGYVLSFGDWTRLRRSGQIVWLFAAVTDEGTAGSYIQKGEQNGVHLSYKCRIRKPWWRLTRYPESERAW